MVYKFATERHNYEDYASGRVLLSAPRLTSFPVRLASEIFQRSVAHLQSRSHSGPYRLYDPCCGGGYLLTVLGFFHGNRLAKIWGSDVDGEALEIARRNLSLLTERGLRQRIAELEELHRLYQKKSHSEAVSSARRLLAKRAAQRPLPTECFWADMSRVLTDVVCDVQAVDLVIADLPYGRMVQWSAEAYGQVDWVGQLLSNLRTVLATGGLVVLVADKGQKLGSDLFRRVEHFRVGKRQVVLLSLQ